MDFLDQLMGALFGEEDNLTYPPDVMNASEDDPRRYIPKARRILTNPVTGSIQGAADTIRDSIINPISEELTEGGLLGLLGGAGGRYIDNASDNLTLLLKGRQGAQDRRQERGINTKIEDSGPSLSREKLLEMVKNGETISLGSTENSKYNSLDDTVRQLMRPGRSDSLKAHVDAANQDSIREIEKIKERRVRDRFLGSNDPREILAGLEQLTERNQKESSIVGSLFQQALKEVGGFEGLQADPSKFGEIIQKLISDAKMSI